MQDFRKLIARPDKSNDNYSNCIFNLIDMGPFKISVQASEFHYCTPRTTLINPYHYIDFEVALFEDDNWIVPSHDDRFKDLSCLDKWEDLNHGVGGYIPQREVQELIDHIEKLVEEG